MLAMKDNLITVGRRYQSRDPGSRGQLFDRVVLSIKGDIVKYTRPGMFILRPHKTTVREFLEWAELPSEDSVNYQRR